MKAKKFNRHSNAHCGLSKMKIDQLTVDSIIKSARKKPLKTNTLIIARYNWLKRRELQLPDDMELANACLIIKNGKEYRAFYSNTLTHVIKKQNYYIQVLN